MRKYLLQALLMTMVFVSASTNAGTISMQDLPEKIVNYMHKKHPEAMDVTVVEKTHFGQSLYEVNFKESKVDLNNTPYVEEMGELFRKDGHLFTNVISMEKHAFNIIPAEAEQSLQAHYPDYEILAMRQIGNPNGVGDEFEITLLVSGEILHVSINDNGKLISEVRQE
jgi:hypothetical protein